MDLSKEIIQKVWERGTIVPNNDPNLWRKDEHGAWIGRVLYGNRMSQFGWEIDYVIPPPQGGVSDESNLRPLQWSNKLADGEERPASITSASGNMNLPGDKLNK